MQFIILTLENLKILQYYHFEKRRWMFALKPGFHIAIRCRKVPAELACNVGNGMLNCMAKTFQIACTVGYGILRPHFH